MISLLLSDLVWRMGWTLLHSLWLLLAIGALGGLLLALLSKRSAALRYAVACSGLAAMIISVVVTFAVIEPPEILRSQATAEELPPAEPSIIAPEAPAQNRIADTQNANTKSPLASAEKPPPPSSYSGPRETIEESESANQAKPIPTVLLSAWMVWLVGGWLSIVALLSVWNIGGWVVVQRLRRSATQRPPAWLVHRFDEARAAFCFRGSVQVVESTKIDSPMVIGWLRPMILFPPSLVMGLSLDELDAVLVHELAHIRRHDYFVNLLQTAAETILFFHPAVWLLSRRIRVEREYCCDDAALCYCRDKAQYSRALLAVQKHSESPLLAVPFSDGDEKMLLNRIRRIMGASDRIPGAWQSGSACLLVLGLLFAALSFGNHILADSPPVDLQKRTDGVENMRKSEQEPNPQPNRPMAQNLSPPNLLEDGGFENPPTRLAEWTTHGKGKLGSWTVNEGTVDVVGSYWKASEGKQSLDLSGDQESPGTIYQDVPTEPGKTYHIQFSTAANPEPADAKNPKQLKVLWGEKQIAFLVLYAEEQTFDDVGWQVFDYNVKAYGQSGRLQFQSLTNTPCGPILDGISVKLVREK